MDDEGFKQVDTRKSQYLIIELIMELFGFHYG